MQAAGITSYCTSKRTPDLFLRPLLSECNGYCCVYSQVNRSNYCCHNHSDAVKRYHVVNKPSATQIGWKIYKNRVMGKQAPAEIQRRKDIPQDVPLWPQLHDSNAEHAESTRSRWSKKPSVLQTEPQQSWETETQSFLGRYTSMRAYLSLLVKVKNKEPGEHGWFWRINTKPTLRGPEMQAVCQSSAYLPITLCTELIMHVFSGTV